jgi:hypothetical protein
VCVDRLPLIISAKRKREKVVAPHSPTHTPEHTAHHHITVVCVYCRKAIILLFIMHHKLAATPV